jgi:hypothetical protein
MSVNEVRHSTASFPNLIKQNKVGHPTQGATGNDTQTPAQASQEALLTADEKAYFTSLFPQAAADIQTYQVYSPAGKRSMAQSGTLIDRKG